MKYLNMEEMIEIIDHDHLVPILGYNVSLQEWLNGRTIAEASNGESLLIDNKLREGIVITPMTEMYDSSIGRIILKKRSPEYLCKEK